MKSFADRLADAVRAKGNPLCVGIDPRWESLPHSLRSKHDERTLAGKARAFEEFGLQVLELIAEHVPVVKPQSAFFEACGAAGFAAQQAIIQKAAQYGLITVLDAKRGDIASTASAYAEAAFSVWGADAVTVNPFLGRDAVEPFIQNARKLQRGVFVLVRTSNAGSGQFQGLLSDGKPLFEHVATAVGAWNRENLSECGYGDVGAVIGATHPKELESLRTLLPDVWFLIPGFGVQGGNAEDIASAFQRDGLGAIVNSSRGITFPFHPDDPNWKQAIVTATKDSILALNSVRARRAK